MKAIGLQLESVNLVGLLIIADSAMAWPVPTAHSGSSFRLSGLVGLMVRNVESALVARSSG